MWLDELSGYGKLRQGPTVQDLPRQLREIGSPVVVVATCRLGEDEEAARANVGKLLRRLTPVYPADISREEGEALVKMLAKVGVKGDSEEFDGTPGSVLLGVYSAHARRYLPAVVGPSSPGCDGAAHHEAAAGSGDSDVPGGARGAAAKAVG